MEPSCKHKLRNCTLTVNFHLDYALTDLTLSRTLLLNCVHLLKIYLLICHILMPPAKQTLSHTLYMYVHTTFASSITRIYMYMYMYLHTVPHTQ